MRRRPSLALTVLAIVVLLAGCASKSKRSVADPRVGKVFYLCCNLRYDPKKPEITDAIPTQGTLIPFATRVEVQKVTTDTVLFQAAGHPPITLDYDHGTKALPFDHYLGRLFVTEDPRLKLKKVPARQVKLVEKGSLAPGMTRDQVLMAVGYPPADRTPSLEATSWIYGGDSSAASSSTSVHSVSSVQRGSAARTRRKSN
jgi:hypothetical protein